MDVVKQTAVSINRKPAYKNNAAAVSTLHMIEQDLCGWKQTLVILIESVEACDSSDLDVLDSLSSNFEEAGHAFSDTGHALCDTRKRFGYARSEELVESVYHYLLHRLMNARSLLKDQHDQLSQVKAHKFALDKSRQNLETLIESAYYTSGSANDIPSVEHIFTKIDSSVTQMSQRLKSLVDYDNDLAKQNDSLINEQAPHIIRSLRTRIVHLQRRKVIVNLKNEKKSGESPI